MGIVQTGGCHCAAVRFTFTQPANPVVRRCNCTICAMKGVVMMDVPMASLSVSRGKDVLTQYRFGSGEAKHHFCSSCGIHPFHQLRSEPDHYGVNIACIDGMSIYDMEEVPVFDGRNHPADTGKHGYVGVMTFMKRGARN